MEKETKKEEEKEKPFWQELLSCVVLVVVVILVKHYIVSPVRVNGISMVPTLKDKDYMLLNKIGYRVGDIKRFDIVVIEYEDEYIIKRVIGLPGEKVAYQNNKLYINGSYVKEDYTREDMDDYSIGSLGQSQVPEDCYFVLGDNRPVSKDSRIIGFVPRKNILGKSAFTLLPFDRFGSKK